MANKYNLDIIRNYYNNYSDDELAGIFLTKKTSKEVINYEYVAEKCFDIKSKKNKDGSLKYPYYASLTACERIFFHHAIVRRYVVACRNPNKYDVNLESLIAVYDKLIEANLPEFEAQFREAERKAINDGLDERNFTTTINTVLIEKLLSMVASINLENVDELTIQ